MRLTEAWSSYMWACSHLHTGDLEAALPHFARAYKQRYALEPMAALDALVGLALTQQLMCLDDEAMGTLDRLGGFARELNEPQYQSMVHSGYARISLLRGDLESAVARARMIDETPTPANLFMWLESPPTTQSRAAIAVGSEESLERAAGLLRAIRELSEACRFTCQMIEVAVLQALVLEKQERTDEAMKALEEAVILAEPGGWIRLFVEAGSPMAELLNRLQKRNIAAHYVDRLLSAFSSPVPPSPPLQVSPSSSSPAPGRAPDQPRARHPGATVPAPPQ
jgi:LuxR family maltose regulon positive regulatory protein